MWGQICTEASYQTNFNFSFPTYKSDILIHLSQWQYWWWFWFSFFWTFYYFVVLRTIKHRTMKMNPKLNTSLRSRGKWGDFLIAIVPLSWCGNILTNSNFILRMIEWQNETSLFTVRIHGKQWYWVYKFDVKDAVDVLATPKNIGKNRWIISTPNDLHLCDTYLEAIQLRGNLEWMQEYWNEVFKKELTPYSSISLNADIWQPQNLDTETETEELLEFKQNIWPDIQEEAPIEIPVEAPADTSVKVSVEEPVEETYEENNQVYIKLKGPFEQLASRSVAFENVEKEFSNAETDATKFTAKQYLDGLFRLIPKDLISEDFWQREELMRYYVKISLAEKNNSLTAADILDVYSMDKQEEVTPFTEFARFYTLCYCTYVKYLLEVNLVKEEYIHRLVSDKVKSNFEQFMENINESNYFSYPLSNEPVQEQDVALDEDLSQFESITTEELANNKKSTQQEPKKDELPWAPWNKTYPHEINKHRPWPDKFQKRMYSYYDFWKLSKHRVLTYYEYPELDNEWDIEHNIKKRVACYPFRMIRTRYNSAYDETGNNYIGSILKLAKQAPNDELTEKNYSNSNFLILKQKRYKKKQGIFNTKTTIINPETGQKTTHTDNLTKFYARRSLYDNKLFEDTYLTDGMNSYTLYKCIRNNRKRSDLLPVTLCRRLLRTKRTLVLPAHVNITLITNSYDVVHSWFLPGLGLKIDCVPGRSTHHSLYLDNVGFYYGQCAEICGRYHHHMPIRVCALPFEHFLVWWQVKGLPKLLRLNRKKKSTAEFVANKYVW